MPVFHTTLHFSQPPRWGWVEQFWWEGPSPATALAAGQQLAQSRYALLGAGVILFRVTVAVPGAPRTGLSARVAGNALAAPAMPAVQAVEVRLMGQGVRAARRSLKLGGVPASGVIGSAEGVEWVSWLVGHANAWLDRLLQGGWRLLVEQPVGPQVGILGLAEVALEDADPFGAPTDPEHADPASTLVYCQMAQSPAGPATSARLWGAKLTPSVARVRRAVNGTHPLYVIDDLGVYWPGTFGGGAYVGGGTVQLYRQAVVPLVQHDLRRLAGRKVGPAPANLSPGEQLVTVPTLAASPPGPGPVFQPAIVPPIEVAEVFQTSLDMAIEVFAGYLSEPAPQTPLVGLAQVADTDKATYVLFLGGIDNTVQYAGTRQWANGLLGLVGLPDTYTGYVRDILREHTPDGSQIITCGHSLGGIVGQSLEGRRANLGRRRVILRLGFGCPSLTYTYPKLLLFNTPEGDVYDPVAGPPPTPTRLFAVRLDPVVWFTPAGDWVWLRLLADMASLGTVELIVQLENLIAPQNVKIISAPRILVDNPYTRHLCYPRASELAQYAWDGVFDPDQSRPALKTGPVMRFPWPPNP